MRASLIGVVFGLAALTACVSEQPATQAQAQKLGETCQAYGFRPGTDTFAACIFQLDQQRIGSNRQRRMTAGMAMANAGSQMQANAARAPMIRTPMTCTSTPGLNGALHTSCY